VQSTLTEFQLFAIVPDPTSSFAAGPALLRFRDSDVILARGDVVTSNAIWAVFSNLAPLGGGFSIVRGWTAATARVADREFRFVNTHLETQGPGDGLLNAAQAQELVTILGAEALPIVMVGDFNSAANPDAPAGTTTPTYAIVTQAAGYSDAWALGGGGPTDGKTCCHAGDLSNASPAFTQRIDFIFLRGFTPAQPLGATMKLDVLGDEAGDRFAATDAFGQPVTLWPSDHAGVVASFVPAANVQP
jgi:hypothetical protein